MIRIEGKPRMKTHLGPIQGMIPRSMVRAAWLGCVVLLLTVFGSPRLAGQSSAGAADVEGVVVDQRGATVANAAVTIRNLDNGFVRTLTADAAGHFAAQAIPVGHYQIEASAQKGVSRVVEVQLTVGGSEAVMLTVRPVSGDGPQMVVKTGARIASTESLAAATVLQRLIEEAPVRGRAFPDFVLLTPGIVQEASANGLSIAGQRSINSNVSIDGMDFNDPLRGNQRGGNDAVFFFPLSAVQEFQVVNGGATAEAGRTTAGFVNVVTRSGTNEWHGEAFYLNRASALTSPDAFGNPVDASQHQFGGAVGGPIRRERIFEFISAEQNFLHDPFQVVFQPQPAGVTLPDSLAALQGPQTSTNDVTTIFARTDARLTSHNMVNLQYSYTRINQRNVSKSAATTSLAQTANFHRSSSSEAVRGSLVSSSAGSLVNDLRGQIGTDFRNEDSNLAMPLININGVGQIGGDANRPRIFESTRYELSDTLSFSRRTHNLRLGADWNATPERQEFESNIDGRYDFSSLANFIAGRFLRYRGTISAFAPEDLIFSGAQGNLAFFAEDTFSLRQAVTATLGVRWEAQWNPQPPHPNAAVPETTRVANDLAEWQPRAGIAWNVGGAGRMVVRLFAGMLAANTLGSLLQRDFTDNGLTSIALDSNVDPMILALAPYPNALTAVPAGIKIAPPDVIGFASDFRNPRSAQAGTSVQQAIGDATVISAEYLHTSAWRLQRRLDRNLFTPTIDATGMPIFPLTRPNPAFRRISINRSDAHSDYDALILAARRRLTRRLQFQAGYTLSRNRDDDSNERSPTRETALNPLDPSLERAYASTDVRHNLTLSGLWDLPHGFTASAGVLARSALPYTPIIGFDTQNDGNDNNDRAIMNGRVAGRNSMRQDRFFNLDVRLSKAIVTRADRRLNLSVECNNLTRNGNKNFGSSGVSIFGTPTNPSPTAGMPLFAPPTTRYGGPRQVELGMSFDF